MLPSHSYHLKVIEHVLATEFDVADASRRIYVVHVKLSAEPEVDQHVEPFDHFVRVDDVHSRLLLQEVQISDLFLESNSAEVLLAVLQGLEGELPVQRVQQLQTEICIAAINQLLDNLVDLENSLVVRRRSR